jgi:ribosome biogenesis GTPase
MEVGERTTELVRPPIANVDLAVLVFSMREPMFSASLLDKFLVHTELAGVDALIVLSKADLASSEEITIIQDTYSQTGYTVIPVSTRSEQGLAEVSTALSDHITVIAGQSGVGKSSLINAMFPLVGLQTGEVSEKLGRGRHTTRHVELIPLPGDGYVADTPGFSSLEFTGITEQELASSFREFIRYADNCKFRGCLHLSEPGCAVRYAVEAEEIDLVRYQHYQQFSEELKEQQRRNKQW